MIKLIGEKLQQYDLDRTIEIIPSKGRTVEMVRFIRGRRPYMLAHREEGGKIIADIPNVLLKAFGNVLCIVDYVDEDGHIITENCNFHVHKREKPADYQYKETDTLEIGEGGTGGGGDGAPSDWNADEGEPGHVLNRTHYEETVVGYVIPPCTPQFLEDFGAFATTEPPLLKPSSGNSYTVMWNGTSYNSTAFETDALGVLATAIGNSSAVGGVEDTGEPFLIVFIPEEMAAGMGFYTQIMPLDGATELLVSVSGTSVVVHQIDKKFIPEPETKNTNIVNGVLSGTIRSVRAREEKLEGTGDYALGVGATALGQLTEARGAESFACGMSSSSDGANSFAGGYNSEASEYCAFAYGDTVVASAMYSHAEGSNTQASGNGSHAEGYGTKATVQYAHAEGDSTEAFGISSHAEGRSTRAWGHYSHAEGQETVADSEHQHVQGKYNIADSSGVYAHIVGNGETNTKRSNAHTLDWGGNAWFAGTMEGTAVILASPNGTRYKVTVDDSGTLSASKLT